jgi:hypothetical protein
MMSGFGQAPAGSGHPHTELTCGSCSPSISKTQ